MSHILVALMLVVSILAPSVYSLCDTEIDSIAFIDTSEQENESKAEVDLEEKILLDLYVLNHTARMLPKKVLNTFYLETNSSQATEILLPPPEPAV